MLLLDTTLPDVDGVEVTRRIVTDPDTSAVHVLILSASEQDEEVFAALRAGPGYLPRDTEPGELADGIRSVATGEAALSASVVRRVIAELASQPDLCCPPPSSSTS